MRRRYGLCRELHGSRRLYGRGRHRYDRPQARYRLLNLGGFRLRRVGETVMQGLEAEIGRNLIDPGTRDDSLAGARRTAQRHVAQRVHQLQQAA